MHTFFPEDKIPSWTFGPLWYIALVLLFLGLLLPRIWEYIERIWWRLQLGNSSIAKLVTKEILIDFALLIHQIEQDAFAPRPLAVLLAIPRRLGELRRLTRDARGRKHEQIAKVFESSIRQLNQLWREGTPPDILRDYISTIEECSLDGTIPAEARLRGQCAVAVVKYCLGQIQQAAELGERNWKTATQLDSPDESFFRWIAAYGYFNATLFIGNFEVAMDLMSQQWFRHYAALGSAEQQALRTRVSDLLILNPILAIPRHIILAAAFNEAPNFAVRYWPSEKAYSALSETERTCKLQWVLAWYREAVSLCVTEPLSLAFSHAYAGFYFTLLLLEPNPSVTDLHERIKAAFDAIDESTGIVARYAKYGFSGVYHLVCGEPEIARDYLRRASAISAISGNRFADTVFACCHAVAAARLEHPTRYMEPEVKHYLSVAQNLADSIDRDFYKRLCDAARAAVCKEQRSPAAAERYARRSRQGQAGNRILRIFQRDALGAESSKKANNVLKIAS